jgi:hypothetical protein
MHFSRYRSFEKARALVRGLRQTNTDINPAKTKD